MSLDLRYQVKDKQLNASNELIIDQFELGEKVDNPDAVKLPLRLAALHLKIKMVGSVLICRLKAAWMILSLAWVS